MNVAKVSPNGWKDDILAIGAVNANTDFDTGNTQDFMRDIALVSI